jgi:hypothetical protein
MEKGKMISKNRILLSVTFAIGAIAGTPAIASAAAGAPPPGAILDLGGGETGAAPLPVNLVVNNTGVIPGAMPALASVDFTASAASTNIALAMIDDPAGVFVWNVAVKDLTNPSASSLLTNGNFANGLSSWTLLNPYNTSSVINAHTGCGSFPGLSTTCVVGGNGGAYDTIDQTIATKAGDVYQLSFYYGAALGDTLSGAGNGFYNDVSTNGFSGGNGNAIDILAYANPVTQPAPEIDPASALSALTLLAGGLMVLRGRKQAV